MKRRHPARPFRSSREEIKKLVLPQLDTPQTRSPSYKIAFTDTDFILHKELRPMRLQLELLKTEMMLHAEKIESTIVIFGSARIPEPKAAEQQVKTLQQAIKQHPHDPQLQKKLRTAERIATKSKYYDDARKLAEIISRACQQATQKECVVITGGGPGIMEGANRGAQDANAVSIGLNILLPYEQAPNPYVTPELCFQFHYFAIRKMHFLIRARALVAFPGGYGTLDELFEALTLLQTSKIKPIPVLLYGKAYWSRIINFDALVEEGTITEEDLKLFQYVETPEDAWQAIVNFHQNLGNLTHAEPTEHTD